MTLRAARSAEPGGPWASGAFLVLLVALTRIPFFARTLFEFDSVNYAVALTRYDLAQDTPHFPGYPLHVGIGRLLFALVGDANRAYVLESFLLSIGAVLLVWFAARRLAGPRAALLASVVFVLNPFLWFYGAVATAYPHEAFFTALAAALGVQLLTAPVGDRRKSGIAVLLAAAVAVAGAARPTALLFLLPAALFAMFRARLTWRAWATAAAVFTFLTAAWVTVLLTLAGGLSAYIALGAAQTVVRHNSMFFDGNWERHGAMALKCLLYLAIGTAPFWTLGIASFVHDRSHTVDRAIRAIRNPVAQFLWLLCAAPLAFYLLVFYAKPGYLLNIFSVSAIGSALLLGGLMSRPTATARTGRGWLAAWCVVSCAWFLAPMPWKNHEALHRDAGMASSTYETLGRYPTTGERLRATLVKAFEYSSSDGISAVDEANEAAMHAIASTGTEPRDQTIIATWWGMWAIEYQQASTVYLLDVRTDYPFSVWRGERGRKSRVLDSIVAIPSTQRDVILFLSRDHYAFDDVARQVHLEPLAMPSHLEAWRITDEHFRLSIGEIVFEK